jgi:lycopene cyclase domain-containing protein
VPAYTLLTVLAVAGVVVYELTRARTGLFGRSSFWLAMAIVWGFQILVDGWLTKLSSPIVIYDPDHFSGWRIFFDSPVEDFGFGFALVALTLIRWEQARRSEPDGGQVEAGGAGQAEPDGARRSQPGGRG